MVDPGKGDHPVVPAGKCDQFSLTLGADQLPEVLRRVANAIEGIEGFQLLDVTVSLCEDEATASVYYWKLVEPETRVAGDDDPG